MTPFFWIGSQSTSTFENDLKSASEYKELRTKLLTVSSITKTDIHALIKNDVLYHKLWHTIYYHLRPEHIFQKQHSFTGEEIKDMAWLIKNLKKLFSLEFDPINPLLFMAV